MNTYSSSISVLLGNDDGSFQEQVIYTVGLLPRAAAIGTFRDQTKLHLAVINTFESSLVNTCP